MAAVSPGPSIRATVIPLPSRRIWNTPVTTIAPAAGWRSSRRRLSASPPCRDEVVGREIAVTAALGPVLVVQVARRSRREKAEVLAALVARDDLDDVTKAPASGRGLRSSSRRNTRERPCPAPDRVAAPSPTPRRGAGRAGPRARRPRVAVRTAARRGARPGGGRAACFRAPAPAASRARAPAS